MIITEEMENDARTAAINHACFLNQDDFCEEFIGTIVNTDDVEDGETHVSNQSTDMADLDELRAWIVETAEDPDLGEHPVYFIFRYNGDGKVELIESGDAA